MRKLTPKNLTNGIPITADRAVSNWWQHLSPADRRTLRAHPPRAPRGLVGRYVEPAADKQAAWLDYYEYLVNHEIRIVDGPTFHICSAHPAARAAISSGTIPAAFACPRADAACPMRAILDRAPGCSLRIELTGSPES